MRVRIQADRALNQSDERRRGHYDTVAPHQHGSSGAHRFGQLATKVGALDTTASLTVLERRDTLADEPGSRE